MFKYVILFCSFLITSSAIQAQTFQSANTKTRLLELYSSQGCSSCPPAERWVSKQLSHPQLWHQFIPVVFHVDYWDYLGWKDPFSNKQFSQRQRHYYRQGAVSTVYTPGFIFDGKEWRGWYQGETLPATPVEAGVLSANLSGDKLKVSFQHKIPLRLNVALLGFGIKTDVQSGENDGKHFTEDFVVLNKQSLISKNGEWNLSIKTTSPFNAQRYALAIWVNSNDNQKPLQATGGWIK